MNRPARWGLLALVVACASGCRSDSRSEPREWTYRYEPYRFAFVAPAAEPPRLGLSEEQLARALEKQNVKAARRHEKALDLVAAARKAGPAEAATAVSACYALGERDTADELTSGEQGVWTWDRSTVASVTCAYRTQGPFAGGALEVTVKRRPGVVGPIAIAFPPGTYGVAADGDWTNPDDDRRYGKWPSQQDLALLRAPVISLGADQAEASLSVPIACASFESGPPANDQVYALRRFEPGSKIDRLMIALCARERTNEPEAQLSVWLARNDISWEDFVSKGGDRGGLLTFGTMSRILPRHGKGAAKLLIEAGVNPGYSTFFADHRTLEPVAPEEPEKPAGATP